MIRESHKVNRSRYILDVIPEREQMCYQEIVFLAISSPHPPRVAKRVPLRVVSYVNVHPSVCPSVYRSSLGNAKFTAAITGLIFFVLSLNHVRSSPCPCSVPPLKYTLLRAPRLLYLLGIPFLQNDLLGSCDRP